MSYSQILWSLEAIGLEVIVLVSFQSDWKSIKPNLEASRLGGKTPVCLENREPVSYIWSWGFFYLHVLFPIGTLDA